MKPKIVIANGDHCVQMYAIRDIEPGEELCFDYGYGKDVAPDWAKRGARKLGGGTGSKKQAALHETEEDETGQEDNGSDSSESDRDSGSDSSISNERSDSESDAEDDGVGNEKIKKSATISASLLSFF